MSVVVFLDMAFFWGSVGDTAATAYNADTKNPARVRGFVGGGVPNRRRRVCCLGYAAISGFRSVDGAYY